MPNVCDIKSDYLLSLSWLGSFYVLKSRLKKKKSFLYAQASAFKVNASLVSVNDRVKFSFLNALECNLILQWFFNTLPVYLSHLSFFFFFWVQ